jgi:DNA-binding protein YbaB
MEGNMDEILSKFSKETSDYFSSLIMTMKQIGESLEGNTYLVEDENKYVKILINGKQRILSIEITDTLYNSSDKNEITNYLVSVLNKAIQESEINNVFTISRGTSKEEYDQVIINEKASIVEIINQTQNKIIQFMSQLQNKKNIEYSNSKKIKLIITGINIIELLQIDEEYMKNNKREKIADEVIETINRAINNTQQEVMKIMEKTDKAIAKKILTIGG